MAKEERAIRISFIVPDSPSRTATLEDLEQLIRGSLSELGPEARQALIETLPLDFTTLEEQLALIQEALSPEE